jgi:hypothetical protein
MSLVGLKDKLVETWETMLMDHFEALYLFSEHITSHHGVHTGPDGTHCHVATASGPLLGAPPPF